MSSEENMKIIDGELTKNCKNKIFSYDPDDEEFIKKGKEFIEELNTHNFLKEWIDEKYIKNHPEKGISIDQNNPEELYEFIKEQLIAAGFKGDRSKSGFNPHFLKKWLNGELLISKREDAFRLGFALKINDEEFRDFMFKACLKIPYNFKSIYESVYYYCLKEGKSYSDARRIISEIENAPLVDNKDADNDTEVIEKKIASITEEKELVKYLTENKSGFEKQYRSAVNELKKQLKIAFLHMKGEKVITDERIKMIDIGDINISATLKEITGYGSRTQVDGKEYYNVKICKSKFPKLIKDNFPTEQKILKLIKDNNAKPSENDLRKSLILLIFYNSCCVKNENREHCVYDDYIDAAESTLNSCGLVQLYERNPYDAMFSYCAWVSNPLDAFRALIDEYYISMFEGK